MSSAHYNAAGRLAGKAALVTGAASGIGRGIAQEFALQGARVLLADRDAVRGAQALEEIRSTGVPREHVAFAAVELTEPESCRRLIAEAAEKLGALDILVNNAGNCARGNVEDTSLELWEYQMALNLRAPFLLIQAAIPYLRERGGSIVNIGSVNASVGETRLFAYSVSKAGLLNLTKNAAAYLNQYRIRVNVLNVGWTLTEGEDVLMRGDTGREDWLAEANASRAFGRLLSPHDIALAALYFASDESALVTGSDLDLEQHPVGARGTIGR